MPSVLIPETAWSHEENLLAHGYNSACGNH